MLVQRLGYFVAAMLGSLLMMTLVYYGNYRFTHFTYEVFFVPCIELGGQQRLEIKRVRSDEMVRRESLAVLGG